MTFGGLARWLINPDIHWKDWWWSWSSNTLAIWCEEPIYWKRPWCWERLRAGGEGGYRVWADWIASLTQWKWVWANSRRWWRTRKPGMPQSMGSQGAGHDLVTEQQQHKIWCNGKESAWQCRRHGDVGWSLGCKDFLEKGMKPTTVFLPGKSHGQRSLADYSPGGFQKFGHNLATEHTAHYILELCFET